ncbi:MAG: M23 family metallopeptidase [Candidatus Aminicenantes bacterium]|jgi:murein DD-endopeptidase MepM/ murein hydrolase activator NlpD
MHINFDFKPILENRRKKRKTIFYLTLGVFIFVLVGTGVVMWEKDTKTKEQDSLQPDETILPSTPAADPEEQTVKIEYSIKNGDTIINILKREGVEHQSAYQFFTQVKPVYNLKKICAGKKYTLFLSKEKNEIKRFIYEIDPDYYLEAWKDETTNCYKGKTVKIPYQVKRQFISGIIRESLFESILEVGEKPELADMMASLYEYDIDFNRDIRRRDSFALLVEKLYLNGEFIRYGHVLAAHFTNRGKTIRVIRYSDPEGNTAYYHPDGRSVRKMFLRCPLPFMRVTSRYGNRRHPLLKFSARHYGVDLAAPVGTKIRATASGIVKQKGYTGSRGRFITIRHNNQYVSHYYHLSRFAKGIRPGIRVEQGQIIGYVGRSGWATGPHLHYGLQKSGRFMNPLSLRSPSKDPVKKVYLEDFKQYAARVSLLLSGSHIVDIPESITEALLEIPASPLQTPINSSNSIGR